ncbi:oxygenase MpaB family protein [Nocardia crassostreae]|uniref:oxygenase MpaB family protein n=1 Tax=Nocardia crassostreae TaxID=53428 RepID=UPI000836D31C|nr:oxygenase MpaB family protein [Nocardia crassostreae]
MTAAVAPIDRAPRGARPERRAFGPGSRMWEDTGLITFSLTAGSAFLLQTMEPSIAAVVDEHSVFRTDAIGRAARSIASVMMWIYGGDEALAEADRLRAMHATLNSTDAHGVKHRALSSGPWAWVLHTAVFAFTEGNKYFSSEKLTEAEIESYYQEVVQLMRNFSVAPKEIPATYADWLPWFEDQLENHLVPTNVAYDYLKAARTLAPPKQIPTPLHPLWRTAARPVGRLQHFFTIGTTPEIIREKLGIEWTATDERTLRILGRLIGHTVPLLPERIRYFPIAYEARRLERDRARLRKVITLRPL